MASVEPKPKKRRHAHKLYTKRAALTLLGARPDGTFGPPHKNPLTDKPITHKDVAQMYSISSGLLTDWKKRASSIMPERAVGLNVKNEYKQRMATFSGLEQTLYRYMLNTAAFMKEDVPFSENAIVRYGLQIRNLIVVKLDEVMQRQDPESDNYCILLQRKEKLQSFKASPGWANNFINRHELRKGRGIGKGGYFLPEDIDAARFQMQNKVCAAPLECISNSDEISLLYRSFTSPTPQDSNSHASLLDVKDRLTAVLTVYADGTKGSLTIIGKHTRPPSFPAHFDPVRDKNVFYQTHHNAWNTKKIWTGIVNNFDNTARLQGRKVISLVDDCSAHTITYDLENYRACLLPFTLAELQPVSMCVGRIFKVIFRKLLIQHLTKKSFLYIKAPPAGKPPRKMSTFLTIYEAVVLMANAWDLVPKRVVLEGWLKCGVLVPYQRKQVVELLNTVGESVEPAAKVLYTSASQTEKEIHNLRLQLARADGEKWSRLMQSQPESFPEEEEDVKVTDCVKITKEEWIDLRRLKLTSDFKDEDVAEFLSNERELDVASAVCDSTAMVEAVEAFVSGLDKSEVDANLESDVEEGQYTNFGKNSSEEPSIPRFVSHCEEVLNDLEMLRGQDQRFVGDCFSKLREAVVRGSFAATEMHRGSSRGSKR